MGSAAAQLLLVAGWLAIAAAGCHGPGSNSPTGGANSAGTGEEEGAGGAGSPPTIGEGPGGEMVPGLALPPVSGGRPPANTPGASAPDPAKVASQEELIDSARQALDEDRPKDALAIVDVLVVLDPEDPVAIELRALTLDRLGDHEGARDDRKRCCKLGQASCCD